MARGAWRNGCLVQYGTSERCGRVTAAALRSGGYVRSRFNWRAQLAAGVAGVAVCDVDGVVIHPAANKRRKPLMAAAALRGRGDMGRRFARRCELPIVTAVAVCRTRIAMIHLGAGKRGRTLVAGFADSAGGNVLGGFADGA